MGSKAIAPEIRINDETNIVECTDGFWLYDKSRGMNLAMRAKSETAALIDALEYYQRRYKELESAHKDLTSRLDQVRVLLEDDGEL